MAAVSGAALNGRRRDFAPYQKRTRPRFVRTLIATVELFLLKKGNTADGHRRPRYNAITE
jgi:hypothetical protein